MRKAVRERIDTRVPPRLSCANIRISVHMASFLSHDMMALLILQLMPSWVLRGDKLLAIFCETHSSEASIWRIRYHKVNGRDSRDPDSALA
jgi:hypothetical protein